MVDYSKFFPSYLVGKFSCPDYEYPFSIKYSSNDIVEKIIGFIEGRMKKYEELNSKDSGEYKEDKSILDYIKNALED